MSTVLDLVLGRKRRTSEMEEQKVGPFRGIPMLGLDALGSAAYGPEAALTIMLGAGFLGPKYIVPIFLVILALLGILYFSYLQTISAYPGGGGAYTVAGENLGAHAGLFAAASLLLDYILDVAVGISAGVGALVSAMPHLRPFTVWICLGILVLLLVVNLRGIKESGEAFALPTYLFVVTLLIVMGVGVYKVIVSGGHPHPVVPPAPLKKPMEMIGWWLLIRAFASGCTAMTGVEAVSNGIIAFAKPAEKNAQKTLTAIVVILALLLAGVAFLSSAYHIGATAPEGPGYDSILSQLIKAVIGKGWFYDITIASILAVLALSANTGFADFPRLCRLLGRDGYLPAAFADLSRRLVFSVGILVLTVLSAILIVAFGGVTDRLIPLFAIGAFLAFTFSQAGMIKHWKKDKENKHARVSGAINTVGCIATGISVVIIFCAKFAEGAWISVIIIGCFYFLFTRVKATYDRIRKAVQCDEALYLKDFQDPLVVVTIGAWNRVTSEALSFAMEMSNEVFALHISADEEETKKLLEGWSRFVIEPAHKAKKKDPPLTVVQSPYREIKEPLLKFVNHLNGQYPDRKIAVVIPDLVDVGWYSGILHRNWGTQLRQALMAEGDEGVVVVNVPLRLAKREACAPAKG